MKKFLTLMATLVAVVFAVGVALAAAPDKVTIKEIAKSKAPVTFDHKAHGDRANATKEKCQECHHKDAPGKEQKCSTKDCHGAKAEGKKLDLKEAYHKQCKGCHQKEKKGPVKCDECHKK